MSKVIKLSLVASIAICGKMNRPSSEYIRNKYSLRSTAGAIIADSINKFRSKDGK